MFNYHELPVGLQEKVLECLIRINQGEHLDIIFNYIEEGGSYSHLFEEMRLRLFLNDLFNRDIKVPNMFPEEDREEIWEKISKGLQ